MSVEEWERTMEAKAERHMRMFPVGSYVTYETNEFGHDIRYDFERFETRGYMIVTSHAEDGWLRFDNEDFTREGGSWNPNRFKVIDPPHKVELDEDLFRV